MKKLNLAEQLLAAYNPLAVMCQTRTTKGMVKHYFQNKHWSAESHLYWLTLNELNYSVVYSWDYDESAVDLQPRWTLSTNPKAQLLAQRYWSGDLPLNDAIVALHHEGLTLAAIAKVVGMGLGYCTREIRRAKQ